jgi:hypothetical protein
LQGTKLLTGFMEIAGFRLDRPQFNDPGENVLAMVMQHRTASKYRKLVEQQTDLKVVIQNLNNFFYEVMRDRDAYKPFHPDDFIVIFKICEVYDLVDHFEGILPDLCSPDKQTIESALTTIRYWVYSRRKWEPKADLLKRIVVELRKLTSILAAEPIMVDSGQHEPILDKPRSYADVQNQIATDLANLRQFHAKAKLGHTEVLIQTLPLHAGVDDTVLHQRIAGIQQTTRDKYCTSRQQVEQDILTRQEQLTTLVAPQRKTKQEEII